MRDPARIKHLLALLETYWDRDGYRDLRLAQIIGNLTGKRDPYYFEDSYLIAALEDELIGEEPDKEKE